MLDSLYPGAQLVRCLAVIDGQLALQDAGPAIEFLGHEMHGATVPGVAGIEDALVCIKPRVGGQ